MWTGYNSKFEIPGDGGQIFVSNPGGGISNIWHFAEQIEMADDAYYFMANNYPTQDRSAYVTEINQLCTGFEGNNGKLWTADHFNDDIIWATMAFARAYSVTGNSEWLSDAETNFMAVWGRAQPIDPATGKQVTDGSWGLGQETQSGVSTRMYANVNYAFVIAGHILYDITGQTRYRNPADAVYQWCQSNLYVYNAHTAPNGSTCSRIYTRNEAEFGGTPVVRDSTYNYGIAIDAATREGDNTAAQTVANWVMYNIDYDNNSGDQPYNGTFNGYNVLPNYVVGTDNNDTNDAGFNGICLRGFWYALQRGVLTNPDATPWAQANVQCAWNNRDSTYNLTWCDWQTPTSGTRYSWGDSCAMVGMFNIPAPGGYN
jgi:hypothetical protein